MLEFVDSDLYFVQDKNDFINPLLQVGSVEKSTGSGSGGPKITGSGPGPGEKKSGSGLGSDLKSKWRQKYIHNLGRYG